jgi:hypothetical protein
MTSARIRTGWPIPYGTAGQSAANTPSRISDVYTLSRMSPPCRVPELAARPTRQPGSWWASRRVGLSFTLPAQAPHDANRRASEADPSVHSLSSVNTTEVNHDCRQGHPERADKDAHA